MSVLPELPSGDVDCDICIIGTGPVGIAFALECERHGLSVLALDAGSTREPWYRRREKAEIRNPSLHAPIHVTTRSAFGGTSWAWSGDCAQFDDTDFQIREHVPNSGWPLSHRDIEPFYTRTAKILNCRVDAPVPDDKSWTGLEAVSADNLVWLSTNRQLAPAYWQHFARSKAITLCLNSTAIMLDMGAEGDRVEGVVVESRGRRRTIRAPRIVIAAGGLRTTQLMLATQRRWPNLFGGEHGPLGRYYMGHLTGWLSTIVFDDRGDADHFRIRLVDDVKFVRRRLTISGSVQAAEQLLNIAFWPTNPAFYDPSHSDGTLSMAFLVMAVPVLGHLMAGPVRRAAVGPYSNRIPDHFRNILSAPISTAVGTARALFNWSQSTRDAAGSLSRQTEFRAYSLQYHAESAPRRESKVILGDTVDHLGLPNLKIDLRFEDADAESVVRAHDVLDRALRKAGKGRLEYWEPPQDRLKKVKEQALDGYHQMGTTRMGHSPKDRVVDRNCRVHGVSNLYVASSSVFPTGGHANPTLLAASLAVRLADHLAELVHGKVTQ
jgi:choline dehydrogenase-like flavoprotein